MLQSCQVGQNMSEAFRTRKKFVVDRDYQFHFIRFVLTNTLITSLILVGIFYFFQKSQMEYVAGLTLGQEKINLIQTWTWSIIMKIISVVVLASVFQCVLALIFSNRASGPMYRLKNYLSQISRRSELQPIQFRRDDHFHGVQDAYNEMVGVLEKERQNDLRIIEQMEDGIANLKKLVRDEHLFQLAEYIERLNSDLKNFKTH